MNNHGNKIGNVFSKVIFIIGLIIVFMVIGIISHRNNIKKLPSIEPDNFEQCALVYPVIETYPEQCNTPQGKHFVQEIPLPSPEPASTTNPTNI